MNNHNAFENSIFEHYRQNQKRVKNAIKFLNEQGYEVRESKVVKADQL